VERNVYIKILDGKECKIVRNMIWRYGQIWVSVPSTQEEINKWKEEHSITHDVTESSIIDYIGYTNGYIHSNEIPFECDFYQSFDGCSYHYYYYNIPDEKIKELEEYLDDHITDDLEDELEWTLDETTYHIRGEFKIESE
jgi:hypothetical protein